jgi:hypothetical protein
MRDDAFADGDRQRHDRDEDQLIAADPAEEAHKSEEQERKQHEEDDRSNHAPRPLHVPLPYAQNSIVTRDSRQHPRRKTQFLKRAWPTE